MEEAQTTQDQISKEKTQMFLEWTQSIHLKSFNILSIQQLNMMKILHLVLNHKSEMWGIQ